MSTCTFFGHRDVSEKIEPTLRSTLLNLIEKEQVNLFYVGNNGNFDNIVRKVLKQLKQKYSHINYAVVLAYMPYKTKKSYNEDYSDTIFPDALENAPPKYAINKRNIWMLDRSDYVVAYVSHITGDAAKFKELSEKKGKTVLNLAEKIML